MVKKIVKRDGREVKFEKEKIYNAISKAVEATNGTDDIPVGAIVDETLKLLNEKYTDSIPSVEDVQDIIENVLINKGYNAVAKNYIVYRANRSKVREAKTKLMQTIKDITFESSSQNDIKTVKIKPYFIDCKRNGPTKRSFSHRKKLGVFSIFI